MRTLRIPSTVTISAVVLLAIFVCVFLASLHQPYPMLGHDYFYAFPRLLVGKWHMLSRGLMPLRYAPQFCGGFPLYGNPNDMFYSLPQMLSMVVSLWSAVQVSIIVAMVGGYAGWVLFGRHAVRLSSAWAHVLALIIVANGYYFVHMIVGHLTYHTLPLMGWFLWFLFDHRDLARVPYVRMAIFALLSAYVLYSGGYFVLILTALTAGAWLPFDLLRSTNVQKRTRQIALRIGLFGFSALILCISKIVAMVSLMRFFERSVPLDSIPPNESVIALMLRMFFAAPQLSSSFSAQTNTWGIHEYSMFLSPVVLIGLCTSLWAVVRRWESDRRSTLLMIAWTVLLFFFLLQLVRGTGFLADLTHMLPLFSSIRVTLRLLYVLQVIFAIIAIASLSRLEFLAPFEHYAVATLGVVTVLAFVVAYVPLLREKSLYLAVNDVELRQKIAASPFLARAVTSVSQLPMEMSSDLTAVLQSTTSPNCYEPLMVGATYAESLFVGPVNTVEGGSFNIYNPSCLQYPTANGCTPGDRIRANDPESLLRFTNGLPTIWKVPVWQRIADVLTLLGLVAAMGAIGMGSVRRRSIL